MMSDSHFRLVAALVIGLSVGACGGDGAHGPDGGDATVGPTCRRPTGSVQDGWSCDCDDECQPGAFCALESATGLPGGECFRLCDPLAATPACASSAVCLGSPMGMCTPSCLTTADCPVGRACATELDICYEICAANSECESGICDFYQGRCVSTLSTAGAGLNAACVRDADCRSQLCSSGICVSFCRGSAPHCPENGTCVTSGDSDLGTCSN